MSALSSSASSRGSIEGLYHGISELYVVVIIVAV